MAERSSKGRSTAAHVSRTSHTAGGGHHATLAKPPVQTPGIARKRWDVIEEEQMGHPQYGNRKWPEYEYREYPKWVGDVVVENAEEESALLAGKPEAQTDERARLVDLATANSVIIDKRWGNEKLTKALTEAGIEV